MTQKERQQIRWGKAIIPYGWDKVRAFKDARWCLPELNAFFDEVKGFSYPETCGISPWEFTFSVAWHVFVARSLPDTSNVRYAEIREACLSLVPDLPDAP